MEIGNIVQIQDNSDWHNLYGLVESIGYGIAKIFAVARPGERYWVKPELRNKIRVIG